MIGLKDGNKINEISNELFSTLKDKNIGEPDSDYV